MRKIQKRWLPLWLLFIISFVGCSGDNDRPPVGPSSTDTGTPGNGGSTAPPPEGQGTAVLVYVLSSNQKNTGFRASSDIGIPIAMFMDADNPKDRAIMQGSNIADYHVQMPANDQGRPCTLEFTLMVQYEVRGFYNPDPQCDFDVRITGEVVNEDEIVRSGTCSMALHNTFPANVLFIPPPPGLHKIPGSLPVVPIRNDGDTKITLELKNVVVPTSSGCFFGG